MENLRQTLLHTADFLALSLAHEWAITPFDFEVIDPANNVILVSVYDTGIIVFEPQYQVQHADSLSYNNKDIILSCGIHGNETAPIEICNQLIQRLILGQMSLCQRVMFVIGNLPAINAQQRFFEENLNALFSGVSHSSSSNLSQRYCPMNFEQKRAATLEGAVTSFYQQDVLGSATKERLHYDLHTGIRRSQYEKFAIYPYLHGKEFSKEQLYFLNACGINTIVFANAPTTTFSYFSAQRFNAHSFTIELGKVKPFGANNMADFNQLQQMLVKLLTDKELTVEPCDISSLNTFIISQRIDRFSADFHFNFTDDTANFTQFSKGTLLVSDGEKRYYSSSDHEAILFPNNKVTIGQRALLLVQPINLTANITN